MSLLSIVKGCPATCSCHGAIGCRQRIARFSRDRPKLVAIGPWSHRPASTALFPTQSVQADNHRVSSLWGAQGPYFLPMLGVPGFRTCLTSWEPECMWFTGYREAKAVVPNYKALVLTPMKLQQQWLSARKANMPTACAPLNILVLHHVTCHAWMQSGRQRCPRPQFSANKTASKQGM